MVFTIIKQILFCSTRFFFQHPDLPDDEILSGDNLFVKAAAVGTDALVFHDGILFAADATAAHCLDDMDDQL